MPTQPRRHPHHELTAVQVRQIKKPGRHADGNGLCLVVEPTGAKRWVLRTVVRGRRRDIGLGSARLVSLVDAREMASTYRRTARAGGDPIIEHRKPKAKVPTFEEAARLVHSQHARAWRNPKHAAQWINTLAQYAFPYFGDRRVDEVEQADVLRALVPIWLTKQKTARRVRQRMRAVFDWAKGAGHRRDVVMVRPGLLPKTSSGKIKRAPTRQLYLDGTLTCLAAAKHPVGMTRRLLEARL